jgi:molybdenum cofactor synthesis domain-containing protein
MGDGHFAEAPRRRATIAVRVAFALDTNMNQPIVSACVLIIGNEILSGRTQDTNLRHITIQLNECGIRVREARVVPDVESVIVDTVRSLRTQFDYVFTTGGIGPTHDDITAECIAKAFNRELVIHPEIVRLIQNRQAPPDVMAARMLMARVPAGAGLIENPTGGPPGFFIENVYVMAGIPSVMHGMLSSLAGKLRGGAPVRSRSVTAYLAESQIAAPLGHIQRRYPGIDLGSYPFAREARYGTTLVMRGIDATALDAMLADVISMIVATGGEPQDVNRA